MVIEDMMWFCCGHHVQDGLLVLSGCCDFLLVSGGMALNRHGSQPAWPSHGMALNRHGPQPANSRFATIPDHSSRVYDFLLVFLCLNRPVLQPACASTGLCLNRPCASTGLCLNRPVLEPALCLNRPVLEPSLYLLLRLFLNR